MTTTNNVPFHKCIDRLEVHRFLSFTGNLCTERPCRSALPNNHSWVVSLVTSGRSAICNSATSSLRLLFQLGAFADFSEGPLELPSIPLWHPDYEDSYTPRDQPPQVLSKKKRNKKKTNAASAAPESCLLRLAKVAA